MISTGPQVSAVNLDNGTSITLVKVRGGVSFIAASGGSSVTISSVEWEDFREMMELISGWGEGDE